jgi:hypothetical protein
MAECIQTLEVCQTAREKQDYAFNLTPDFAIVWQADRPAPAVVRAIAESGKPGTGLEYASSGGQTNGKKEPSWPTELAAEPIADGSAMWTAQALSFASLKHRIASVAWDVVAGITLSDQVETDLPGLQEVRITVSGGTAGTTYTCPGLITTVGGKKFEVRLLVTIDA